MSARSERRLIRQALGGDREECTALIRDHHAAIYRFLARLTRDVTQAEDLTQETFAAAWQRLDGFRGQASLRSWLHRIAYRKFLDARRAASRRPAECTHLDGMSVHGPSVDPLTNVMMDEQSRRLHLAVRALGEADRLAIELHYMQELSYREMAEVLGEPVGTVKSRTNHALAKLRRQLEGAFDDARRQVI
jgi:RNA polymerase sigma-70 factor, ECF subfamily